MAKSSNIIDLPQPQDLRPIERDYRLYNPNDVDLDDADALCDYSWRKDRLRNYAIDILEKLTVRDHYELIDRIYGNLFGRLAYICKETVRETTYFKP